MAALIVNLMNILSYLTTKSYNNKKYQSTIMQQKLVILLTSLILQCGLISGGPACILCYQACLATCTGLIWLPPVHQRVASCTAAIPVACFG